MNSKERKEGYTERLEWRKRKGKLCHYIIISKIKEKSLKKKGILQVGGKDQIPVNTIREKM